MDGALSSAGTATRTEPRRKEFPGRPRWVYLFAIGSATAFVVFLVVKFGVMGGM
jgi:hypothetical protein